MHSITWYAMVKWCNARSQKDNLTPCYTVDGTIYKLENRSDVVCDWSANGYRLPTEAEWEKAARGGLSGYNFPWGDTINHTLANYKNGNFSYEFPQNQGFHPTYSTGGYPYTAPVNSFAPNGYGLYNMSGNVWTWCWDRYVSGYYASSPGTDPRGPASGSLRVLRGGGWGDLAFGCRVAVRGTSGPTSDPFSFRVARSSVP